MKYELFFDRPAQNMIRVNAEFPSNGNNPFHLLLSSWRPGRYELSPYAENICDVSAKSESGNELLVEKTAYNKWTIPSPGNEKIIVSYCYYAFQKDAGNSFFDEELIYINPINLMLYPEGKIDSPVEVKLNLPEKFQLACGIPAEGNILKAKDYHEIFDSPILSSPTLKKLSYDSGGTKFNIWMQGKVKLEDESILADFKKFTDAQMALFGGCPVKEYHFLFIFRPDNFHHGVEHQASTVIVLGPASQMNLKAHYDELLSISCHELFHTWNVKAIRPLDMQPYIYERQNYSRLHYVTEGVTTYYGELMLLKAGVWDLNTYIFSTNESAVKRHFANNGKDHISLEEASFDSWINGYKEGTPNRKISFYTKGALAALVLDYIIREKSHGKQSLDAVMKKLYNNFGKTGKGYTKEDYRKIAEEFAGGSLEDYFSKLVSGTDPIEPWLQKAVNFFGLEFFEGSHPDPATFHFGFNTEKGGGFPMVKQVFENSPASAAGLRKGDVIIALNEMRVDHGELDDFFRMFADEPEIHLHFFRSEELKKIQLKKNQNWRGKMYQFRILEDTSLEQEAHFNHWISIG